MFQHLAATTWRRIGDGHAYGVRQGEEGISDWLLLEIVASHLADVRIVKTGKTLEAIRGTDWEWWIGNHADGWLRYAVQAKIIDVPSSRFTTLNHKVKGALQFDVLQRYATQQRAIPVYCLYSFLSTYAPQRSVGHCPRHPAELYGCSIVPEATIRAAAGKRGAKTFASLDQTGTLFPWCCLVCSPVFHPSAQGSNPLRPAGTDESFLYERLPLWLEQALESPEATVTPPIEQFPEGAASRFLVANRAGV